MRADFAVMAINFRGRIEGLHNDLAGNYENVIGYTPADYEHPYLIRKSLDKYKRAVTPDTPMCAGFFKRRKATFGLITNWANLYQHLEFENCVHVLHSPLMRPEKIPMHVVVIFMASKTEIAVATYEDATKTSFLSQLNSGGVVKDDTPLIDLYAKNSV